MPRHIGQCAPDEEPIVVLGHLRVGERVGEGQAQVLRQFAADVELDALAAHLAGGDGEVVRIGRIGRQHIVLGDPVHGQRRRQPAVGGIELRTRFRRSPLLRRERRVVAAHAAVGPEAAGRRRIQRERRAGLVDQARARRGRAQRLGGGDVVAAVEQRLVVAVVTHTQQQLPPLAEIDLVLRVQRASTLGLARPVGERHGRRRRAMDGIEEVDRRGGGDSVLLAVVDEPVGIGADQQVMHESGGAHRAQQFQATGQVGGVEGARAPLPRQRAAIGLDEAGFGRGAVQRAVALAEPALQRPVLAELALDEELVPGAVDGRRSVAGFAIEGMARHAPQLSVQRDDAAVEGRGLPHHLQFIRDRRVRVRHPEQRRRQHRAARLDMVPVAAGALPGGDQPKGQALADRTGGIGGRAEAAMAADRGAERVRRLEQRLPGRDVDGAAGLATPVQRRGRPLEHLDGGGAGGVAQAVVAAARAEAIDQVVGAEVRIAGEAAHRVAVPQAAEVALAGDAAGQVQRLVQARGAGIGEQCLGQHPHALRDVAHRCVGLHRAGDDQRAIGLARASHRDGAQGGIGRGRGRCSGRYSGRGISPCGAGRGGRSRRRGRRRRGRLRARRLRAEAGRGQCQLKDEDRRQG